MSKIFETDIVVANHLIAKWTAIAMGTIKKLSGNYCDIYSRARHGPADLLSPAYMNATMVSLMVTWRPKRTPSLAA